MINDVDVAQSQETFAQRSRKKKHFAKLGRHLRSVVAKRNTLRSWCNNEDDEEGSFLEYDFPWIDFDFDFDFDFLDLFKNGIDFREKGYDEGDKPIGKRDTPVVDLSGTFDLFLTFLGRQYGNSKSNDKGTNGGKPTSEDKADDIINAADNISSIVKEKIELNKENTLIQIVNDTVNPNNNRWITK